MATQLGFAKLKFRGTGDYSERFPAPMIRQSWKVRHERKEDPESPGTELTRAVFYVTAYVDCQSISETDMLYLAGKKTFLNPFVILSSTKDAAGKETYTWNQLTGTWTVDEISADADGLGHDRLTCTFHKENAWA